MFKYIKYDKVETEHTVLEIRGGDEELKVAYFSDCKDGIHIVSISNDDEAKIDAFIAKQPTEINCIEVTKEEFKAIVERSNQLQSIRRIIKDEIAKGYDVADEIGMSKLEDSNQKKIDYNNYVADCIQFGRGFKEEVGY